uniref:Uncharacterized protein n=1 Tax=Setaria digitata TaxID=48799 RepID=A0A915Q601_9BILA
MCQQAVEKCGFLLQNGLWPSFVNCSDTINRKDGRRIFSDGLCEPGKIELWQVFRKDMCQQAVEKCGFLLQNGLWPSFVNCSDTINRKDGRRIFSDGLCEMTYNKEPSKMKVKQCLWPLAVGISHSKPMSRPVIDDCYLPCRSPLISSQWLYDGFRMLIFAFSLLMVIGGLVCTLYLSIFSLVFTNDLCVYSLTHALLSATVHWFIWLLSYFDHLAERAMCFDMLRRDETVIRGILDWCSTQFWILHSTILSGFFWLLIALIIQIVRPKLNHNQKINWNQHRHLNLRCFLLILYLLAGFIATIGLWTSAVEVDGITGVCYFGFRAVNSVTNLHGPIMVAFILFSVAAIYFRKNNEEKSAIETCNDSVKVEQVALVEDKVINNRLFDCGDARKNGYSQMTAFWRSLFCVITSVSYVATVMLHNSFLIGATSEREIVLDSVRCSLNKTIMEGQTRWLHETVRDLNADTFSRRASIGNSFLSASGCELPSTLDDRLLSIFLVYLFLPSLPFFTVILYVLTGLCDYGMTDVEKVRARLNPFVLMKYTESTPMGKKQPDKELITATSIGSCKLSLSQRNILHSENNDKDESLDTFPADLKIRRLDVLQRSKERRRQQMENGYLFLKPVDPAQMTTAALSAYQNGLIEGRWRERCVNYEKQIKALSANLRVADYEIRRLAGLEMPESGVMTEKRKLPHTSAIGKDQLSAANVAERDQQITTKQLRLCQSVKDVGTLTVDSETQKNNPEAKEISAAGWSSPSLDVPMQKKSFVDEESKTTCQPPSLKPQTFFGVSASRDASDKTVDDDQASGSCRDSDSFNSDEEDSEEERLYNEKVRISNLLIELKRFI